MYLADGWKDFAVLDAGGGMKRERWKNVTLLRPDPQAVWPMDEKPADAVYIRSASGGGHWEFTKSLPESWRITYGDLTFLVRPTGFKHTGLFPEQAVNWDWMRAQIARWKQRHAGAPRVLNLFAYTGGATVACAKAGASLVHVDAAKGMVSWAKDNARESGLADAPIRYIVDDCAKFVKRELRRGSRYDGILMDPPSYGRGPTGELWKIENDLWPLVKDCAELLSDTPAFFLINSYTTGLSASVLANVLRVALPQGHAEADEVGLPIARGGMGKSEAPASTSEGLVKHEAPALAGLVLHEVPPLTSEGLVLHEVPPLTSEGLVRYEAPALAGLVEHVAPTDTVGLVLPCGASGRWTP